MSLVTGITAALQRIATEINTLRTEIASAGGGDLKAYCATGSGTDISTTAATVALATEQVPDSNYSLSSNQITVTDGGEYHIDYSVQIDEDSTAGGTRRRCNAWVEDDATLIPQSEMSTYTREASGGGGISNGFNVILGAGSVLTLEVAMDASGPDTSVEIAQMSIMKVG